MSLLQKFTNLFKQKDELQHYLQMLLKPTSGELNTAIKYLTALFSKQPAVIFALLRQRETLTLKEPQPENLINLLLVIHKNISNQEVCEQLRQSPIFWIDRLMNENRESFILLERMITEQSTNSYFPQLQPQINQQQTQSKGEKLEDKRKARIQMNQQLQSPIINTEAANNTDSQNLQPNMFCIIYYSFLQKLSINQQVYQSCRIMQYPEEDDNLSWLYKMQNVMQMGLKLLQCPQSRYRPYQGLIYQDLFYFQSFLKEQIEIKIKQENNLDIYEVYCEFSRAKQILEAFDPKHNFSLRIITSTLDEFQRNAIKERVKLQFAQNKKKQSTKELENQENIDQLNFQDFEANHDFEREIVMKKYFDQGQSNQMSLDEITLQLKINI